MALINLIMCIEGNEILHIYKRGQSLWIGRAMDAIDEIGDNVLCSKIKSIYTGMSGLCVEVF